MFHIRVDLSWTNFCFARAVPSTWRRSRVGKRLRPGRKRSQFAWSSGRCRTRICILELRTCRLGALLLLGTYLCSWQLAKGTLEDLCCFTRWPAGYRCSKAWWSLKKGRLSSEALWRWCNIGCIRRCLSSNRSYLHLIRWLRGACRGQRISCSSLGCWQMLSLLCSPRCPSGGGCCTYAHWN